MNTTDVLTLLLKVAIIVISVLLLIAVVDHINEEKWHKEKMWQYEEVYRINNIHGETLHALGIDEVFYYDWEETAHSLNIPVDSLTINVFLKHLFYDNIQ